ncbi:MAG TPA: hypothetical protein VGS06_20815 [Streptosporangiaceae bacterium]|nr:hypothetical protein [Streptosporangiaceae bacterium]
MTTLSTTLTLLIGPTLPVPASPVLLDALDHVEVTTSDRGRSGFQVVFSAGRSGSADLIDYPLLSQPELRPFSRVVLLVAFGGPPKVLMDGVITHRELMPGDLPGHGTLTITGEDVSVMMDLEEKNAEHPAQAENVIATLLIGSYPTYGLIPQVTPPSSIDSPTPVERVPVQRGTDLAYLNQMAARFGFVCYVIPGPVPMTNTVYWGPPVRSGPPQPALTVDMGADTNVERISFRANGLAPTKVRGVVQDPSSNQAVTVSSSASLRTPLSARPDWQALPATRTTLTYGSGLTATEAQARAQGTVDASTDSVTATGTLDALRYGDLLTARGLVGLRGAGWTHDGLWYVQQVTHQIKRGEYTQAFTLTRDGSGSTLAAVQP